MGEGTAAAGTFKKGQPREGGCGQVPPFRPPRGGFLRLRQEEGFAKLALRPRGLPGQGPTEGPPNSPHPAGLLRSAPRPLPYLPPPSAAPGLTGDEPSPVPLGAGRSAPKQSLEEGFLLFFFPLLIFSSFPRSQKALQRPSSTCDFAAKVYLNDSKRVKLTSSRFCPVNPGPCGQP